MYLRCEVLGWVYATLESSMPRSVGLVSYMVRYRTEGAAPHVSCVAYRIVLTAYSNYAPY